MVRFFTCVLMFLLYLGVMESHTAYAASIVEQGECGSCTWTIDSNGLLTIEPTSGTEGTLEDWGWGDSPFTEKNITSVNIVGTVHAKTCSNMFARCSNLASADLNGLDTSEVTNMGSMFSYCSSLVSVDLSSLNTSSVNYMHNMFSNCTSVSSLNLSSWDTSSLMNMARMFDTCSSLASLDISSWDTSHVAWLDSWVFSGCDALDRWLIGDGFVFPEISETPHHLDDVSDRALAVPPGRWWSTSEGKWFTQAEIATSRLGIADTYTRESSGTTPPPVDDPPIVVPPVVEPGTTKYGTPADGTYPLSFSCQFGGTSKLDTTWRDSWFGGGYDGYHYDHDVARACSVLAVTSYKKGCIEGDLEKLGFIIIQSYFPDQEGGYQSDWDECGYAFGVKTVADAGTGKQVPLIVVAVRGTIGNGEWLGNFNVANASPVDAPAAHEGFGTCRKRVLVDLNRWAVGLRLAGLDLGSARVLVTGHSRGAAVAGLVAASLDDGYKLAGYELQPKNVCAYTFASPTSMREGVGKARYHNVFNIVNPEDLIPRLPLGRWGYRRVGVTLVLPSVTNTGLSRYRSLRAEMNPVFRDIAKGNSYKPYPLGAATAWAVEQELGAGVPSVWSLYYRGVRWSVGRLRVDALSHHDLVEAMVRGFVMEDDKPFAYIALTELATRMPKATAMLAATVFGDSAPSWVLDGVGWTLDHVTHGHTGETYIAWMRALDGLDDFARTRTSLMVCCPVDVRVYAPGGELVAEIVGDEVNEELLEGGLAAWVDGDAKHVELPDEEAYRVELTPTADGEMDVALTHRDAEDGVIEQMGYDALALEEGAGYELTTTGEASEETAIADTTELTGPGSEPIEPDYSVSGDGLGSVSLSATAEGAGDVVCPATATRGDYVTARAIADEGGSFEGWYEGGELVSGDAEYKFHVQSDRALVARFAEAPVVFSDVNDATPHAVDIYWLATTGISKGWSMPDGTREFRGMSPVVRQDMAAFLYRLAGEPDYMPSEADKRMFLDVNEGTPHAKEIWWLAKTGISEGWAVAGGREFRGMSPVVRQDMAAFLRRLADKQMGANTGLPTGYANPFSDVNASTPHREDVLWLASSGISEGWPMSGGTREFRGMNPVVRQDMAAFLHRLYNHAMKSEE